MGEFFSGFNVAYLLVLVGISLAMVVALWLGQRAVLGSLSALLVAGRKDAFESKLNSALSRLVLRPGTAALLGLEGAIYFGDGDGVMAAAASLEKLRLKAGERLSWYRKMLAFAVTSGNKKLAGDYLQRMEQLLASEKDPDLQKVLEDARLLVGVYLSRDTSLIPALEQLAEQQKGSRKGLSQYRLAKLYHYSNKPEKATAALRLAEENLEGSPWQQVARRALEDVTVLEKE